jgi:hypothetical protein
MTKGAEPEFESEFPGHVSHQYPPPANAPAAASYKWAPTGPTLVSPAQFAAPGFGGGGGGGDAGLGSLQAASQQGQQKQGGGGGLTVPTEADVQQAWLETHPTMGAKYPWTPPASAGGGVRTATAGESAGADLAASAGTTSGSFMGGLFGLE